jgi:hypothetical protein
MFEERQQHVRLAPLRSEVNVRQKHGLNMRDVTIFFRQDGRPYKNDLFQMDDSIVILMTAALKIRARGSRNAKSVNVGLPYLERLGR